MNSTNHGLCSTLVFTIEKNPSISGPAQFKPMLFKGQLYLQKDPGNKRLHLGQGKYRITDSCIGS